MATTASPRTASAVGTDASRRSGIASFPPAIAQNPYQRLLYEQLARHGFASAPRPRLKLGWLWRNRQSVGVLHFHWPHGYYAHLGRPRALRTPLSLLRIVLFAARLTAARALAYRVVWTVHQVYPHERNAQLIDRLGSRVLARASRLLIAHDVATAAIARDEFGVSPRIVILPHGSYVGVYPDGRPREDVRADLGLLPGTFAFLCFGHVRGYKDLGLLLEAFAGVPGDGVALVVAGLPVDSESAGLVVAAAARDRRIRPLLEFIPDERVAELHYACDAAVLTRTDGGTSGALVLALSLGLPAIAARTPAYAALLGDGKTGWLFDTGNPLALTDALTAAAGDRALASAKGDAAERLAETFAWPVVGERTAALLRDLAA